MTDPGARPRNISAIVALAAGVVALPSFVVGFEIVAWIAAGTALFAGIRGVRRSRAGARGLGLAISGIVLGSFMLLILVIFLALFLTRPFRY